jgi:hypothetical protein
MKAIFIKTLVLAGLVFYTGIYLSCKTTKPQAEQPQEIEEPSVEDLMKRLDEAVKDIPNESNADEQVYRKANAFQTAPSNGGVAITHYNGADSTVVIPETINGMPVAAIKPGVFAGNTAVKEIIVDGNNALYSSANGVLFDKAGNTLLCYPAGKTGAYYAIPERVTTIEEAAFAGNIAVVTVSIPAGATLIKEGAFSDCIALEAFEVNTANTAYRSENGILYNKKLSVLMAYPAAKNSASYTIPDTVFIVDNKAFSSSRYITAVTIPASVSYIGPNAFYGAAMLNALIVSRENTMYSSLEGILFNKSATILMCYPAGKTGEYVVPDGVSTIRGGAFYGAANLKAITITSDLTTIGSGAFSGCTALSSITLPAGLTSIGKWAFYGCAALAEIHIPLGLTAIEEGAFYGCTSLRTITIADTVTRIGGWAFSGCTALKSITLPAGLTSIGKWAFAKCESLDTITLPAGLTSIDEWTFYDCSALTKLAIPSGVTKIKRQAFRGCTGLIDINIPQSVGGIEEKAFLGCLNLSTESRNQIAQRFGAAVL